MNKEEIIYNIARLNSQTWKDREEVRTEIGKLLAELNKSLEQQPCEDVMAIHTQGLDEGIRCAMCTNIMKSDRNCDGGCRVDEVMYKKVMETINNQMFSQPTSDDCVSRQAVIDTVDNTIAKYIPTFIGPYEKIPLELARAIKYVPPVTPTQRWIPVSKRLPNDRNWYLGIFKEADTGWINTIPFVCDYVGKETKATTKEFWILRGFTDIDNPYDYYKNLECVAWQPLPKFDLEWWNAPYKRGNLDGSN